MSDCVYQSLRKDAVTLVNIAEETMMAGLSCGEVSRVAWPLIRQHVSHVITVGDENVIPIMRYLAQSQHGLEAGECSASGFIALMTILQNQELASQIQMDHTSNIVLFGTEGATDKKLYHHIIHDIES